MVIGSRQRPSKISNEREIHVGETTIKRVSYAKTLGVVIDDHLTWERQIYIQTKISNSKISARRISFEIKFISKEIRRAEHEYMNIHPPPPPPPQLTL